jgi:hypothetical protein
MDSVIFRPEVRYDYNGYSRPFSGQHGIFTAGADLIFTYFAMDLALSGV